MRTVPKNLPMNTWDIELLVFSSLLATAFRPGKWLEPGDDRFLFAWQEWRSESGTRENVALSKPFYFPYFCATELFSHSSKCVGEMRTFSPAVRECSLNTAP